MARPCKPVSLQTCHLTKEEKETRLEAEAKLKGGNDKIKPPKHLNKEQKKMFNFIVKEMEKSGVLTNLDIFILTECSTSICRKWEIDAMVNANPMLISDRKLMSSRKDCVTGFFRCCNELGLSPASRSKLANINLQAQLDSEDPLKKALEDDD